MKNIIKKHRVNLGLSILWLTAICSCVTIPSDKRADGVVVERNKQTRPVWADAPVNQLLVNATEAKFHYLLPRQRDLPLAVKQAQIESIEASFPPWRPSFEERLRDYPRLSKFSNGTTESEYTSIIDNVAHKVHAHVAQVEDIYFERVRIEHPELVPELEGLSEFYDVHILVQLQPVEKEFLKHQLANGLSTARSQEMRRYGKELAGPPAKATKSKHSK